MAVQWAYYFGFGSLVNRHTRPCDEKAWNATLRGWQRVWEHRITLTDARAPCTSLSIEPADTDIQGVLVRIPYSELAELDVRESGYERMAVTSSDFVIPQDVITDTVYVYRSLPENRSLADRDHPIAQSYVDCVLAGYLDRFDMNGLEHMLRSTRGWNRTIHNDRRAPVYPRHVSLSSEILALFDSLLLEHR